MFGIQAMTRTWSQPYPPVGAIRSQWAVPPPLDTQRSGPVKPGEPPTPAVHWPVWPKPALMPGPTVTWVADSCGAIVATGGAVGAGAVGVGFAAGIMAATGRA